MLAAALLMSSGAMACGAEIPVTTIGAGRYYVNSNEDVAFVGWQNAAWGISWWGNFSYPPPFNVHVAVTHGGSLGVTGESPPVSYSQPQPDVLEIAGRYGIFELDDSTSIGFTSSDDTLAFRFELDPAQYPVYIALPDGSIGTVSTSEFALSPATVHPASVPNEFQNIFCSGFDPD